MRTAPHDPPAHRFGGLGGLGLRFLTGLGFLGGFGGLFGGFLPLIASHRLTAPAVRPERPWAALAGESPCRH